MVQLRREYIVFFKVFLVTVVLPIGYCALIFGAWLYGRLAGPPDDSNISQAEAAYYAAMVESAQAEAAKARLEAANIPPGKRMAKDFNCTACHNEATKLIGPPFIEVAERYTGDATSVQTQLVEKIKDGGKGNWGEIPMPPHPQYSDEDLGEVVDYILSLASGKTESATDGSGR